MLCKIAKEILDVFKITKLDRILTITADEQVWIAVFLNIPCDWSSPHPLIPEELTRDPWVSRSFFPLPRVLRAADPHERDSHGRRSVDPK